MSVATCDNRHSRMLSNVELLPENKLHKLHTVHPHEKKKQKNPAWCAVTSVWGDHIETECGITEHILVSHEHGVTAQTQQQRTKTNLFILQSSSSSI